MKIIIIIIIILFGFLLVPNKIVEGLDTTQDDMSNLLPDTGGSQCICPSSGSEISTEEEETKSVYFDTTGVSPGSVSDLQVNNAPFTCIKGKDGCIDQIMTYDNNGLPKYNRTPNPATQNFMISDRFYEKVGKKIINCPSNYSVSSSVNNICSNNDNSGIKCIPNDNDMNIPNVKRCTYTSSDNSLVPNAPREKEFNIDEKCKDWCWTNPDCYAVSTQMNKNGETVCYYYSDKIKNKKHFLKDSNGFNSYFAKEAKNIYPEDPIEYTSEQITDPVPLYSNLNQITNVDTELAYRNYTKCLNPLIMGEGDDLLINISKKCKDQIGPGYVARSDEFCDALPCQEEDMYRFKCKFEPLNTTNTYSIDLSGDENIESFSNLESTQLPIPLWKIIIIIIIISLICIYFLKK